MPEVARRVREHFGDEQVTENNDGSMVVKLSTSSKAWLARWVLPFGKAAEIKSPTDGREHLYNACCMYALLKKMDEAIGRCAVASLGPHLWGLMTPALTSPA